MGMRLLYGFCEDVDADSRDGGGGTPLSWAAFNGHEGVVRLLAGRKDVDVNSKDKNGKTPRLCALERGHQNVVRVLLEHCGNTRH